MQASCGGTGRPGSRSTTAHRFRRLVHRYRPRRTWCPPTARVEDPSDGTPSGSVRTDSNRDDQTIPTRPGIERRLVHAQYASLSRVWLLSNGTTPHSVLEHGSQKSLSAEKAVPSGTQPSGKCLLISQTNFFAWRTSNPLHVIDCPMPCTSLSLEPPVTKLRCGTTWWHLTGSGLGHGCCVTCRIRHQHYCLRWQAFGSDLAGANVIPTHVTPGGRGGICARRGEAGAIFTLSTRGQLPSRNAWRKSGADLVPAVLAERSRFQSRRCRPGRCRRSEGDLRNDRYANARRSAKTNASRVQNSRHARYALFQ